MSCEDILDKKWEFSIDNKRKYTEDHRHGKVKVYTKKEIQQYINSRKNNESNNS